MIACQQHIICVK